MKIKKINKQKTTILILAVLLIIAISYISVKGYQAKKQQEQLAVFKQGAQYGYEQAIITIMQQALTCQQVPLYMENKTINLVAVECLK